MRLEGREEVAVTPAEAWRLVNDPAVLRACTPGLERLDETRPGHYEGELVLSLPMMKGRFKGTVDQLERVDPEKLRLRLDGKGPPGFVLGEATLTLAPSQKGTAFHYVADVQVGGQVARLGQRMISGVAREMAGQFFETFERYAGALGDAASGAAATLSSAGAAETGATSATVEAASEGRSPLRPGQRMPEAAVAAAHAATGPAPQPAGSGPRGTPRADAPPPGFERPGPVRAFLQLVWRTLLNLLGLSKRS